MRIFENNQKKKEKESNDVHFLMVWCIKKLLKIVLSKEAKKKKNL